MGMNVDFHSTVLIFSMVYSYVGCVVQFVVVFGGVFHDGPLE